MDRVLKNKFAIFLFVFPAFAVFFAVVIVSIINSGYYSFTQWDGIGAKTYVGVQNYIDLFTGAGSGVFLKSIVNTLILAALTVLIQLPIALIIALILGSGVKGEGFYRTVLFVPVVLSAVVIGLLWRQMYHPTLGLLNVVLKNIGLGSLSRTWLGDTNTALIAVMAPIIWQWIGYHMLLMYASVKSIPQDIREAAYIDGATGIKTALKITIPLMRPILKVCTILAVIGSLQAFDMVYVLTNGGPSHATEVPSTLMYTTFFHKNQYGLGSAMSMFIIAECLTITMIIQKLFKVEEITY